MSQNQYDNQNNGQNNNGDDGQNNNMNPGDLGKQIGDTVRSALQSGDLGRLRDIGPAVQSAVKQATSNLNFESKPQQNNPNVPQGKYSYNYGGMRPAGYNNRQPARYGSMPPAKRQGPSTFTGVPAIVLGLIGAISFGVGLFVVGILSAAGVFGTGAALLAGVMLGAGGLSALAVGSGLRRRKLAARVRQYYAVAGTKGVATVQQLSAAVGLPEAKVVKDIRKAVRNGMMADTKFDAGETCIMVGDNAYKLYLEAEKARIAREEEERKRSILMEEDPSAAAMETFKKDGAEALRRIRRANEAIPGEDISGKMYRMEATVSKILAYVQKHPEKLPETRKLMSYYLPTTIKLLEKYKQYEEMEVQLQNVEKTKQEIEESLDTINTAFENLLESLYQDDTLDVSTDIEVLQTMLRQEGLAGRRFTIKTDDEFHSTIEEAQE